MNKTLNVNFNTFKQCRWEDKKHAWTATPVTSTKSQNQWKFNFHLYLSQTAINQTKINNREKEKISLYFRLLVNFVLRYTMGPNIPVVLPKYSIQSNYPISSLNSTLPSKTNNSYQIRTSNMTNKRVKNLTIILNFEEICCRFPIHFVDSH